MEVASGASAQPRRSSGTARGRYLCNSAHSEFLPTFGAPFTPPGEASRDRGLYGRRVPGAACASRKRRCPLTPSRTTASACPRRASRRWPALDEERASELGGTVRLERRSTGALACAPHCRPARGPNEHVSILVAGDHPMFVAGCAPCSRPIPTSTWSRSRGPARRQSSWRDASGATSCSWTSRCPS